MKILIALLFFPTIVLAAPPPADLSAAVCHKVVQGKYPSATADTLLTQTDRFGNIVAKIHGIINKSGALYDYEARCVFPRTGRGRIKLETQYKGKVRS